MAVSKFVKANRLRLHYLDFGNPAKPSLFCIHGLSGNAHAFDGLAPHMADAYRVMSLDVRGRRDTERGAPGDYRHEDHVSDVVAALEALHIDRVTLIGTSMGGIISMMYAGGYPDRVERLVLNDIGPEIAASGLNRITDYMTTAPADFAGLGEVTAYYR